MEMLFAIYSKLAILLVYSTCKMTCMAFTFQAIQPIQTKLFAKMKSPPPSPQLVVPQFNSSCVEQRYCLMKYTHQLQSDVQIDKCNDYSFTISSFADWLGNEIDLILVSRSMEPVRHEITLLLDKTFVAILSMTKNTTAVSVCFDVKNSVKNTTIIQSGLIKTARRCHQFIFTLFSSGVVCILLF